MARPRPPDRYAALIAAATQVFVRAGGVRRAQIDEVARALGVAKGTVYLYVEGKEALFDQALRHADGPAPAVRPELYDGLARTHTRLTLAARSAVDWPELGEVWFERVRGGLVARLADWVAHGVASGRMRRDLHPLATGRLVAETVTWFAV